MDKMIIIVGCIVLLFSISFVMYQQVKQRQITENLRQMIDAAKQGRFQESGFDESICSALENEMFEYLKASEIMRETAELEREKIQTLITDISHQTKTPVANLSLYTELLGECKQESDRMEYVSAIQKQVEKLNVLIQSLIKMSRLETGVITLYPKKQDIKAMLDDVVEIYREKAIVKGLKLLNLSTHEIAYFDKKWTTEAVGNVLDNAVKYTEKGTITIRIRPYELFTAIEIEDTGDGLDEKEIPKIFQRFYRGKEVQEQEGIGVGLSLAREILSGEGGYMKVSSEKGEGCVFSIFLPKG